MDAKTYVEKSDVEIATMNEKSNFIGLILLWAGLIHVLYFLFMTILVSTTYWWGFVAGILLIGVGEIVTLLQKIYATTKR